jgi:hypothetical protein
VAFDWGSTDSGRVLVTLFVMLFPFEYKPCVFCVMIAILSLTFVFDLKVDLSKIPGKLDSLKAPVAA